MGRAERVHSPWVTPRVASVAVVAGAALVIGAVLWAVVAVSSPWPAVVLPVAVVAAVGASPSRVTRLAVAAGLTAAALGVAATASTLPAVLLAVAAVGGLAVAAWWDHERAESAAQVDAARQLVDAVSVVDETTGCYNASGLDLLARHVLGGVRRSSGAMHASLVEVADLDAVAEVGGPDAVRDVVCAVADALRSCTRGADVVGRWSADVFVVLGPGTGVSPPELERRLRSRLLSASGRPRARWAGAVTVGSGMLEPWDAGGLAELVARAESDLGLRRALRSPSAPEPQRHGRRAADRQRGAAGTYGAAGTTGTGGGPES